MKKVLLRAIIFPHISAVSSSYYFGKRAAVLTGADIDFGSNYALDLEAGNYRVFVAFSRKIYSDFMSEIVIKAGVDSVTPTLTELARKTASNDTKNYLVIATPITSPAISILIAGSFLHLGEFKAETSLDVSACGYDSTTDARHLILSMDQKSARNSSLTVAGPIFTIFDPKHTASSIHLSVDTRTGASNRRLVPGGSFAIVSPNYATIDDSYTTEYADDNFNRVHCHFDSEALADITFTTGEFLKSTQMTFEVKDAQGFMSTNVYNLTAHKSFNVKALKLREFYVFVKEGGFGLPRYLITGTTTVYSLTQSTGLSFLIILLAARLLL